MIYDSMDYLFKSINKFDLKKLTENERERIITILEGFFIELHSAKCMEMNNIPYAIKFRFNKEYMPDEDLFINESIIYQNGDMLVTGFFEGHNNDAKVKISCTKEKIMMSIFTKVIRRQESSIYYYENDFNKGIEHISYYDSKTVDKIYEKCLDNPKNVTDEVISFIGYSPKRLDELAIYPDNEMEFKNGHIFSKCDSVEKTMNTILKELNYGKFQEMLKEIEPQEPKDVILPVRRLEK